MSLFERRMGFRCFVLANSKRKVLKTKSISILHDGTYVVVDGCCHACQTVCMYTFIHIYYVCMYVCMYVRMYTYIGNCSSFVQGKHNVRMCICYCMHTYTYVNKYVHMSTTYIGAHVCTYSRHVRVCCSC